MAKTTTRKKKTLPSAQWLLGSGNGHDWHELSDRGKMELRILIEEKTGRHSAWTHRVFLQTFYDKARDENASLLKRSISDAAAFASAVDIREE